jgi:hypothetical protein
MTDWKGVEAEIERLIRETVEDPFDRSTIANARQLLSFARDRCPVAVVGKGYWSTFRFSWSTTPPVEIEVFTDRFEFYRFYDGRTDIEEISHIPDEPLPEQLITRLPTPDVR